jgi:hypothetical protein
MAKFMLSPRTFGFIVSTRAALGFGLGLLAASRIPESQRRRLALSLIGIGAATTIPAARALFKSRSAAEKNPAAPMALA